MCVREKEKEKEKERKRKREREKEREKERKRPNDFTKEEAIARDTLYRHDQIIKQRQPFIQFMRILCFVFVIGIYERKI